MPELGALLRAQSLTYDVVTPPAATITRRAGRRRGQRRAGLGGALALLLVAGAVVGVPALRPGEDRLTAAAGPGRSAKAGLPIDSLLVEADGRGLLATYGGGMCELARRLEVQESPTQVRLRIVVTPQPGDGSCGAALVRHDALARLAAPLGDRVVVQGERTLVPFDGRRLPTSVALPPGFGAAQASAGLSSPEARPVTDRWSVSYRIVGCDSPSLLVEVGDGPVGGRYRTPGTTDRQVRVGDEPGVLSSYPSEGGRGLNARSVWWLGPTGHVAVSSDAACSHQPLGEDALLAVARSLRFDEGVPGSVPGSFDVRSAGAAVTGLRTDPDGRGLVATYTGLCAVAGEQLDVRATADRVDVTVRVTPAKVTCPPVVEVRTVRGALAAPLGDRPVFDGNRQVPVFDGALLQVPGALPAGYALRSEHPVTGGGWGQVYDVATGASRGPLTVTVGTPPDDPGGAGAKDRAAGRQVHGRPATLVEGGGVAVLRWLPADGALPVSVRRGPAARPLSDAELFALAESLRPAG